MTENPPAGMLSCSQEDLLHGSRRNKHPWHYPLSTTEAEYYALGVVCQEAMWLRQVFQELSMTFDAPLHIYSDNTGAVALSDNPVFHTQSKHIDIRWHFI